MSVGATDVFQRRRGHACHKSACRWRQTLTKILTWNQRKQCKRTEPVSFFQSLGCFNMILTEFQLNPLCMCLHAWSLFLHHIRWMQIRWEEFPYCITNRQQTVVCVRKLALEQLRRKLKPELWRFLSHYHAKLQSAARICRHWQGILFEPVKCDV